LSSWLSADLNRLSDTGLGLKEGERLTLMVQEADPQRERQASWRGDGQDAGERLYGLSQQRVAPPVEDRKLLNEWLETGSDALLLLAPVWFGEIRSNGRVHLPIGGGRRSLV
jgi:hypothetical protein